MGSLEGIVSKLDDADQAAAWQAWQSLLRIVTVLPGADAAQQARSAAMLAAELTETVPGGKDQEGRDKPPVPRYSTAVREKLLRLLGHVAGPAEVPAIAGAMQDRRLREAARCALARDPSDEATAALIGALESQDGPEFRAALVTALAGRPAGRIMPALQKAAQDEDMEVRLAAIEVLGTVPDPAGDALIAEACRCACPRTRTAAFAARLRLAEALAGAGNRDAARAIYKAILAADPPGPQKQAAQTGLKAAG